jgi:membrane-bound metal-dependent hydrolase YbcI (DUF457 family)
LPLPIAHGLVGASLIAASYKSTSVSQHWKLLTLGAFLANFPDFDFFFIWVLDYDVHWHRSFTHSILFAIVVGALTTVFTGRLRSKLFALYTSIILSHSILDALATTTAGGVPLLWPLIKHKFRVGVLQYVDTDLSMYPWPQFLEGAVKVSLIELIVFSPLLFVILLKNRKEQSVRLTKLE